MSTPPLDRLPPLPIWKGALFSLIVIGSVLTGTEWLTRSTDLDRRLFAGAFEDPYEKARSGWHRLITYDPVLFWRGRAFARLPGSDEFLNARGFRGTNFSDTKPAGLRRIVCMGDSATFGLVSHGALNFTYTPTYSSELQRLLNTDDMMQQVEVINAGIIGYATAQGLRLLKHEVRDWQPDVITIRYGINDHLRQSYDYRSASEPRNVVVRWGEDHLLDLRTAQLLLRLREVGELSRRLATPREDESSTPLEEAVPGRVPLPDYEYNLRRMVTEGRATGARIVLLTAPFAPLVPEITADTKTLRALGYPTYEDLVAEHQRYEDVTRKVAADMDVDLLDSSRDLAARGLELFFTRYDLVHPNGEGHAAIARDLAELIHSKHLIE